MRLLKISSKLTSLKNGCFLISPASSFPEPRRRAGSRVKSCNIINDQSNAIIVYYELTFCSIDTASRGIVIGYKGSSSRIASNISSSSSPRNGD